MISKKTKDRWQEIIDSAGNNDHLLTDWEREFVDSIYIQIAQGRELSMKQSKVLHRIAEKIGA